MKATRTDAPTPPLPPEVVTIEMTLEEARLLARIAGYNITIPNALYVNNTDSAPAMKLVALLNSIRSALAVTQVYGA